MIPGSWRAVGDTLHFFWERRAVSLCGEETTGIVAGLPAPYTCAPCQLAWVRYNKAPSAPSLVGSVLDEAGATVLDRQDGYGSPSDNHGRTARIWSAMLGIEVTARMVCLLNIAQKVSRDTNAPKRDNLVDIAGYARCAEMVTPSDPSTP